MFSLIVPVYKVEPYLDRCVKSILNQDFDDFELILVDDGSPDRCPKLCDDYAAAVTRVTALHKENGGVSSARNLGIQRAAGEYLWFIDSDDYIAEDSLQLLADAVTGNASDLYIFNQGQKGTYSCNLVELFSKHYFKYHFGFEVWNKLFKRRVVVDNHLLFDTGETIGEDLLFNAMFYRHMTQFSFIDSELYHYVIRGQSAMGSNHSIRHIQQMRLYQKILAYYGDELGEDTRAVLFLLHLISGINQSRNSGVKLTKHADFLRESFIAYSFPRKIIYDAMKVFSHNEHASTMGRLRIRAFMALCLTRRYRIAALLMLL